MYDFGWDGVVFGIVEGIDFDFNFLIDFDEVDIFVF